MKKEALIALGLSEEQADKVIAEHSRVLADDFIPRHRLNEVETQLSKANDEVTARDNQIEQLKTAAGDNTKLTNKIDELQQANLTAKQAYEAELLDIKRKGLILPLLQGKYHNVDMVLGMINEDALVYSEDNSVVTGLEEQLNKINEEHAYLVIQDGTETPSGSRTVTPVGKTPQTGGTTKTPQPGGEDRSVSFAKQLAQRDNSQSNKAKETYFGEQK